MRPRVFFNLLIGVICFTGLTAPAQAESGSPVNYGEGPLEINNDPGAGGFFLNPTYLDSKRDTSDLFLFNRGTSETVLLSPIDLADLGYNPMDELVFYILSDEGTFYTGNPSRNFDGFAHANVTGSNFNYYVSFEDQANGGDYSYGNAAFTVRTTPGPLPLLGSALTFSSFEDQSYGDDFSYANAALTVRTTPGPLPLLGSAVAFRTSRRLRRRIKGCRPPVASTTP